MSELLLARRTLPGSCRSSATASMLLSDLVEGSGPIARRRAAMLMLSLVLAVVLSAREMMPVMFGEPRSPTDMAAGRRDMLDLEFGDAVAALKVQELRSAANRHAHMVLAIGTQVIGQDPHMMI